MISPTGRAPSHGKMSRSKRPMILLACPGAQRGACFASHSRATASKLSSPPRAAFCGLAGLARIHAGRQLLAGLVALCSGFLQPRGGIDAEG